MISRLQWNCSDFC